MGSKRNPTEFLGYKSKIDITFTKANKRNYGKAGRLFQAQRSKTIRVNTHRSEPKQAFKCRVYYRDRENKKRKWKGISNINN